MWDVNEDEAKAALAADYPAWHIWRGRDHNQQPDGWYATRRGLPTVAASGPVELRRSLEALAGAAA